MYIAVAKLPRDKGDRKPSVVSDRPGRQDVLGRYGFNAHDAPEDIQRAYVGKRVPDDYRKRGAANPIKYAKKA